MAEDDTPERIEPQYTEPGHAEPSRTEEAADLPPVVVPLHDPLPLPPAVEFTRPNLDRRSSSPPQRSSGALPDPEPSGATGHGAGLAAGFSFVASILAGLVAGTWLDAHFNHTTTPWWTMLMTLAGAGVGFTNMFKLLSRGSRRKP